MADSALNFQMDRMLTKFHTMKNGETAVAITVRGDDDMDVLFEDGTVLKHQKTADYINGTLKTPCKIYDFDEWRKKHNR